MNKLQVTIPIRWADLDGYGHVNNTEFLRILEEARIQVFWEPSAKDKALGVKSFETAIGEKSPASPIRTFVASHRIEYVNQLGYERAGVEVQLWLSRIGGASMEIDYLILDRQDAGHIYAKARTVIVVVDPATNQPVRIPKALRQKLHEHLAAPLVFR